MVADKQTPTLAKIKNEASETDARALLYIALCEVCDFFNVGKNMNDTQIAMTVDLIIERFGHLKPTEIKFCFRRAMMRERLFDRLDGNIIIGWLTDYDAERTEEAIKLSEQQDRQQFNEVRELPEAVSYEAYLDSLKERAKTDKGAKELLDGINRPTKGQFTIATSEQRAARDHEFKLWRLTDYLSRKK